MSLDTKAPGPDEPIIPTGEFSAQRSREIMDMVKRGSGVWASELAARASAKGIQWTPEEQARATGILGRKGVEVLDDLNDQSLFAIRTEGVGIEKPLLDRAMDQFASAATLGAVVPSGQYEGEGTLAGKTADIAGSLAGMSAPVGALGKALEGSLGILAHPAAFGAYGAATAGEGLDLAERAKSAAFNTALGLGLGVMPQGIVRAAGLAGPEAAQSTARALSSFPGQALTAGGTMAWLEAAMGGDPLAGGLGGVLAAALTGGLVPGPRAAEPVARPVEAAERPLAGLRAAEARAVKPEKPVEPQDAPVFLEAPVVKEAPKEVPISEVVQQVAPAVEIPEPPQNLAQRVAEIRQRKALEVQEKAEREIMEQQDTAARDEALASGALTAEQARAQRMAESAARRVKPEDRSHVLPNERLTQGLTDGQLYEATRTTDGIKQLMKSGLSFEQINQGRSRYLRKLGSVTEPKLGGLFGGADMADVMAINQRMKEGAAKAKEAHRSAMMAMTGGDMELRPRDPVKDNTLDIAATRFHRTGDIAEYAKVLAKNTLDPARDFITALPKIEDVGKGEYFLSGRTGSLEKLGGGMVGSDIEKHLLYPLRAIDDAKLVWNHGQKAKVQDWIDRYGIRRGSKKARDLFDAMQDPARQDEPVVAELRKIFDDVRVETNVVREATGRDPIGYIENYAPHAQQVDLSNKILGATRQRSNEMPDFMKPTELVNPRALKRYGKQTNIETDVVRLVDRYIDLASRDIFDVPALKHLRSHANKVRDYGLDRAGNLIDHIADVTYAGKQRPLEAMISGAALEFPAVGVIRKGYTGAKRNLNRSLFSLNPFFTALVQPLSSALTAKRAPGAVFRPAELIKVANNPTFREWMDANVYSHRIKMNEYGSIAMQDVGGNDAIYTVNDMMARTKIGAKSAKYSEYATAAMERELSYQAGAAHYVIGQRRGLKGRPLMEFVSDGVQKTQSMFNRSDMPGALQEPDLTATIIPFQTYAFELMNQAREMNIPVMRKLIGKTGHYAEVSAKSPEGKALFDSRMKQVAVWSAAIVAQQAIYNALNIKQDILDPVPTLPFYSFIANYSRPANLPQQIVKEFHDGFRTFVRYGDWKPLRKFALRYGGLRGGLTMSRALEGAEAVADGGVYGYRTSNGFYRKYKKFPVRDDEAFRAMVLGVYTTEGGGKYIEDLKARDKKGFKKIPEATPVTPASSRGRSNRNSRRGR